MAAPGSRSPLDGQDRARQSSAMIDIRPVAHIIGKITFALGAMMIFPTLIDYSAGDPNWLRMAQSMLIVMVLSTLIVAATHSGTPSAGHRVDLVNEDDTGRMFFRVLKQITDSGSADTHKHLNKLWPRL